MTQEAERFSVQGRLHTDRLEARYGPIRAEVLRHDPGRGAAAGTERVRLARLVDKAGVLRTLGVTFLTFDPAIEGILAADDAIRAGGLLGKTFRERGYEIRKSVVDIFLLPLPAWLARAFATEAAEAKMRLSEFWVRRPGGRPERYGTVGEVYSPDFADPRQGVSAADLLQQNPPAEALRAAGLSPEAIWDRLDRAATDNDWGDVAGPYAAAGALAELLTTPRRRQVADLLDEEPGS